jgi:hypothetical protein
VNASLPRPMSRKSARSSRPSRSASGLTLAALGALAVVVLTAFWPTLHSEFVYDSQGEIVLWDWLHDPRNILTAVSFKLMSLDVLDFNRPVAVASLMFDSLIWGRDPFGYHLTSILLHMATTWAVFLFLRHILIQTGPERDPDRRTLVAFLGALLFALHPLVTEAVCEPSNRKDLLATLFSLTALLLAARHRPGWGRGDPARVLLCPFLCLLAVGSKELGAALPVMLLAYWFLFRRKEPAGFWLAIIAGSGVVTVLFLIARFALAHHPSEIFLNEPVYPGGTLANTVFLVQPRIFALYLVNVFWPLYLCADYNAYMVRFLPVSLSLVLLALAAAAMAWWSVKDRRAFFASVFIVATLLPVANLVPIYHAAADRFLYAPLVGIAIFVALALDGEWLAGRPRRHEIATAGLLILLGLLVPVTLQREHAWSSELALWQDTLKRNPTSFNAQVNLPDVLLGAGRTREAKAISEVTLRTEAATWPWAWADYAIELERLGDHAGAERAARYAIHLKPDMTDSDKMARTLQAPRGLTQEFDEIAARLSSAPALDTKRGAR